MPEQDEHTTPPSPIPEVASPIAVPAEPLWRRVGVLRPLGLRDFRLLWTGFSVSLLGDGIFVIAIAWEVYRISNVPTALSIVSVAWSLPLVVFLLIGGVVSDRFDRRRVMIAADLVRMVAIGALALLSLAGVVRLWHVAALAAFYGAGQAFFAPAFGAIVPDLVPKDLLVQANSLDNSVRPLAERLLGPAIGGVIVASAGAGAAFLLDAATFAVSAAAVAAIRKVPTRRAPEGETTSVLAEVKEGFAFVRSRPWLWATLASAGLTLFFVLGPFEVLVPFVIKNRLGGGAHDLGLVFAAGGVGSILAGVVMGQVGLPRRHILFMYMAWAFGVSLMWPYAIMTAPWQAMIVEFVAWSAFAAGLVVWTTLMQRLVPPELLGRVTSLDWLVSTALLPVSFAIIGPLSEEIGVGTTFVWSGVLGAAATLAFLAVPGIRDPERMVSGGSGGDR
jgi:hypothetical protein